MKKKIKYKLFCLIIIFFSVLKLNSMLAFRRFFSNIIYIGPRDKIVVSFVWSSKSFKKQFSKVKKMQIIYVELFTEYLDD